ncbi:NADP-dependent oxidoreductase [Microbacterium kribbense]|uniref:NADP-dependent oxidoreductase n=1 Tax=Microbacterium kribbense TaxID=433645 RepID=A0ABP7GRI4_9MICO
MAQMWIAPRAGDVDVLEFVTAPVPAPGPGEVTVRVHAAGVNPADFKHFARATDGFPLPLGYEVAGTVTALGPGAGLASGGGAVGDEVLAFRVSGGYASELTVPAADVFAKPAVLSFEAAANLLLAGATAAEMVELTRVDAGDVVLIHAASGAVGISAAQQARWRGARVIGTASERSFDGLRRFGVEPVAYGEGLQDRLRALAPGGVDVVLDCVGTPEAVSVSAAVAKDRSRMVTIVAGPQTAAAGFIAIGGGMPASKAFRESVRGELIARAAAGDLVVPVARTYPLGQAREALRFLQTGHPGGKLALIP